MKYNEKYDRYVTKGGLVYRYDKKRDRFVQCKLPLINGYQVIRVSKPNRGNVRVHRLVYETFVGEIPSGYEIDHINIVRDDNRIENLRCVTHKENMNNPLSIENNRKSQLRRKYEPKSEFGIKYEQHFGYCHKLGKAHYCREWRYYKQHKKCSWEK